MSSAPSQAPIHTRSFGDRPRQVSLADAIGERHTQASVSFGRRTASGDRGSFRLQDEVSAGLNPITDDDAGEQHGFFARGRELESVGDAHAYTEHEKRLLAGFESMEYLPANNAIYRNYLGDPLLKKPSATTRWIAMGLIGVSVGFVGFLLKSTIDRIAEWRRSLIFDVECRGDPAAPANYTCGYIAPSPAAAAAAMGDDAPIGSDLDTLAAVHALVAIAFAAAAAAVVVFIQPQAASSGIPEVIAYLNGTHQRKLFNLRTLVVKFVSCFLAVGSGLPVGPEGPMIHMGAMIGRGVSQMRSRTLECSTAFFRHFRDNKSARDFLTAGARRGSRRPGAPVGGLFSPRRSGVHMVADIDVADLLLLHDRATVTLVLAAAFGSFAQPTVRCLHAGRCAPPARMSQRSCPVAPSPH